MTEELRLLSHIQQATKIGLIMKMVCIFPHRKPHKTDPETFHLQHSSEDAYHIFELCSDLTAAQIYRLVKQYAANNPTIVPPSPKFF